MASSYFNTGSSSSYFGTPTRTVTKTQSTAFGTPRTSSSSNTNQLTINRTSGSSSGGSSPSGGVYKTTPSGLRAVTRDVFDVAEYERFAGEKQREAKTKEEQTVQEVKRFESQRVKQLSQEELARRKRLVGRERVTIKQPSQLTQRRTSQAFEGYKGDLGKFRYKSAVDIQTKTKSEYDALNKDIEKINKELSEYKPMKKETYYESSYVYISPEGKKQSIDYGAAQSYEQAVKKAQIDYEKDIISAAAEKGILVIQEKTPSGYKIKNEQELINRILSTPTPYPSDNFGARQAGYALYPEAKASFGFAPQTFEYETNGKRVTSIGSPISRISPSLTLSSKPDFSIPSFDERTINQVTLDRLGFEQGKQTALSSGFVEQSRIGRELEFAAIREAGGKPGSLATEDFGLYSEKERKAIEVQARQEEARLKRLQDQDFAFRQSRADFTRRAETTFMTESEFGARQSTLEMQFLGLEAQQKDFEKGFASRKAYQDYLKGLSREEKAYFGEVSSVPFLQGISKGREIQTEFEFAGTPAQQVLAGKEQNLFVGLAALPEVYRKQFRRVGTRTVKSPFDTGQFNFGYNYEQPVYENIFTGEKIRDLKAPSSFAEELQFRKDFGFREGIKATRRPYTFEDLTGDLGRVGFDIVSGTVIGATAGGLFGGPAGIIPGAAPGFVGGAVGGVADVTTRQMVFRQTGSEFLGETAGLVTGIGAGFLSGVTIEKSIARQFATRGVKAAPLSRIKTSAEMYPQLKSGSVDDLLESFYTGKPQQYFRQEFGFLDEGKPLAIRTTTRTTDISKIPQLAQYEEVAAFYGPDVSMIGLPQFGKQPRRLALFGSPVQERGMIEVLEAKGVSRLPTEETFRSIDFPQYKALRSFSGVELGRISPELIETEFRGIKKGFRPADLYFLEKKVGSRKQLIEAFVPTKAQPGILYPSTQFQLGLSKEAEAVVFYDPNLFLERIGSKGVRQKVFGTPTAVFTEGSEFAGTRFYKPFTKTELENLGLARKTKIKYETFVARQQRKQVDSFMRDYYSGFTRTPLITPGRLGGFGSVGRAFDYRMPRQTYKAPRYDFRVPREFRQTTPRYSKTSYSGLPRMPRQREVSFRDFGYTPTREPTYRPPREPTYRDVPYYPPTRTPTYRPPRTPTLRTPPMTPPVRPPTKRDKRDEARIDYALGTFNAFVRKNNNTKWVKATKKALPYNAAFNQGLSVADNTVARSVKLKRASKSYSGMDDPFIAEQKFRRRKQRSKVPGEEIVFVEKQNFLLDTTGEIQGLRAAKYLKQQGGGLSWDF